MQLRTLFIISLLSITTAGCKTSKSPKSADGSQRQWHWDDDLARDLDKSIKKSMKENEAEYVRTKQKKRFNDRLDDLEYNF